jgi:hypothetical protein
MFNPAYPFTRELLDSFIEKKVAFIVRQTYTRGFEKGLKGSFQFSHYHEKEEAEKHFNSIRLDEKRFMYDMSNNEHIEKLKIAASQPPGYKNYSSFIGPKKDEEATKLFRHETERFLRRNTEWNLSGHVKIYPKLSFQLGELYVRITHEGDLIIHKFEVIENS